MAPLCGLFEEAEWTLLRDVWKFLYHRGAMEMIVFEDRERPADSRIVVFDSFGFVTDDFVRQAHHGPPYIAREMIRRYVDDDLPILTPGAAARHNAAGGLNSLHLWAALPMGPPSPGMDQTALNYYANTICNYHRGYQCKAILVEPFGATARIGSEAGGFQLLSDYASYYTRNGVTPPPDSLRPYLMKATREGASCHFGSRIAPAFNYQPARFGFSESEQEMLRSALCGQTDEDLAETHYISLWTVKKRWQHVYKRVESIVPTLLQASVRSDALESKRGAERRRHLLSYLRDHPEELCRFTRQKPAPAGERETLCTGDGPTKAMKSAGVENGVESAQRVQRRLELH
jgi:DNA-binding CsgD family transcriptional regulator